MLAVCTAGVTAASIFQGGGTCTVTAFTPQTTFNAQTRQAPGRAPPLMAWETVPAGLPPPLFVCNSILQTFSGLGIRDQLGIRDGNACNTLALYQTKSRCRDPSNHP
jgi:hypothetical protein